MYKLEKQTSKGTLLVLDTSDGVVEEVTVDFLRDLYNIKGIKVEGFNYETWTPCEISNHNYVLISDCCIMTTDGVVKFGIFDWVTGILEYKTANEIYSIKSPVRNIELITECLGDLTKHIRQGFSDKPRVALLDSYTDISPIRKDGGFTSNGTYIASHLKQYIDQGYIVLSKQLSGTWSLRSTPYGVGRYFSEVIANSGKDENGRYIHSYSFLGDWQYRLDNVNKFIYCDILSFEHPSQGSMW